MKKLIALSAKHKVIIVMVAALLLVSASSFLTAEKSKKKEGSGKGYLGVNIERMTGEDKEEFGVKFGILVSRVVKGDAAEKAGIKKYDVIQYFNDEKVRRPWDLTEAVREVKPGSKVTIKLVRDGKEKNVTAVLGEAKEHFYFSSREPMDFKWFEGDNDHKGGHKFLRYRFGDGDEEHFVMKGFGGAFLGVNLSPLSEGLGKYFGVQADGGALVMQVEEKSPAEEAGIKDGDVILKLDGKKVSGPKDVVRILSKKKKDDKIDIQVMREKKQKSLKVQLAERKGFGNIHILGDHLDDIDIRLPRWHMETPSFHGHGDEEVVILKKKAGDKIEKKKIKIKKHKEEVEKKEKEGNRYKKVKKVKVSTYI